LKWDANVSIGPLGCNRQSRRRRIDPLRQKKRVNQDRSWLTFAQQTHATCEQMNATTASGNAMALRSRFDLAKIFKGNVNEIAMSSLMRSRSPLRRSSTNLAKTINGSTTGFSKRLRRFDRSWPDFSNCIDLQ
jgi:hypothetical protein